MPPPGILNVAVMFAGVPPLVPALTTNPELVTIAVAILSEDQMTMFVTSCAGLPPLKVMVAAICWLVPSARLGVAGVTVKLVGLAFSTVRVEVEALTDPNTAEMFVVPAARPVASPAFAPKSRIVAAEAAEEFH